MKTLEQVLKYGTFTACAYEAFAGFSGLAPTISHEVGLRLWLGLPILVGLTLHFYWPQIVALFRKGKP